MIKRTLSAIGKMRTKQVNKKIRKINARNKKKGVELVYAQAEQRPAKSIKQALKNGLVLNPNKAEYCSAYATRIAKQIFQKEYVKAHAWELAQKNKLVYESKFNPKTLKGEVSERLLRTLIKKRIIKPGTILGVYYPESGHNQTQRKVTHAMLYV